jgi:hypothetical protein
VDSNVDEEPQYFQSKDRTMNLPIAGNYIRQIATQHPSLNVIMRREFPEAFVIEIPHLKTHLISTNYSGEYRNKSFQLSTDYHWSIKRDSTVALCLIPSFDESR